MAVLPVDCSVLSFALCHHTLAAPVSPTYPVSKLPLPFLPFSMSSPLEQTSIPLSLRSSAKKAKLTTGSSGVFLDSRALAVESIVRRTLQSLLANASYEPAGTGLAKGVVGRVAESGRTRTKSAEAEHDCCSISSDGG